MKFNISQLRTVDGETLMSQPLRPPDFVVSGLLSKRSAHPGRLPKGGKIVAGPLAGGDRSQGRAGLEHGH